MPIKEQDEKSLENLEVCKLVEKHFKEAKRYRGTFEEEWRECEDFYAGKHWKDKNRSFKNLVFPLVEQEISVLTDALPSTDILPRKEERELDAKMLEASIHFTYEQQSFFLKLVMALRSALKTGTGFHYIDFDPDADHGQGMTTIKTIPWEYVYLDPAASEIDEAAFVGIKVPTRVSELKRRFPNHAEQIKATSADGESIGSNGSGQHEARHNYGQTQGQSSDKMKLEDMAILEEAWIRDFTMVDIPEEETAEEITEETEQFFNGDNADIGKFEDHAAHIAAHEAQLRSIAAEVLGVTEVTEQDIENLKQDEQLGLVIAVIEDHIRIHRQYLTVNPDSKKPKYNESLRLILKTGGIVLYDGEPPVEDGMVPLVPYYCYKDESSIYGTGEVKNILPSQKSFNEMDNAEYESLHLTSNPGWVMSADAGVDPSTITNKRGKVYIVKPGSQFARLEPGQTSPQLSVRKQSDQQFMEIITGMNEASQGRRPGGVTAAKAIERLQQQTNGRIRLKSSTIALYSLPRLGKLVASRNAKYWTTERFMRVTDNTSGQVKMVKWLPEQIKDLEYDVRVTQGSLAGTDKEAQAEVLAAYVEKGWIQPKTYFQIVDIPNKAKVLEALEEMDQTNAQMQQLQTMVIQMKAQYAPETLTPEEMEAFQQMQAPPSAIPQG